MGEQKRSDALKATRANLLQLRSQVADALMDKLADAGIDRLAIIHAAVLALDAEIEEALNQERTFDAKLD
jgi:hypothetical protein